MADLRDLRRLWVARQKEDGLRLIAQGNPSGGVELLESLGAEALTGLTEGQRAAVAEAYIAVGKCFQGKLQWPKSLVLFKRAATLLPVQCLLQDRIHAFQLVNTPPLENPHDPAVRTALQLSPGRIARHGGLTAVDEIHALGRYVAWAGNTVLTERIRDMKRRSHPELAQHLAGLLAGYVARHSDLYERIDVVVAVPPDPEKFARRGYGPTDMMLEPFGRRLALPVRPHALGRDLGDDPTREASPEQVLKTIHLNDHGSWLNYAKEVLLLEDVVVHGKNVNACAIRLKEAGAKRVTALALASTSS